MKTIWGQLAFHPKESNAVILRWITHPILLNLEKKKHVIAYPIFSLFIRVYIPILHIWIEWLKNESFLFNFIRHSSFQIWFILLSLLIYSFLNAYIIWVFFILIMLVYDINLIKCNSYVLEKNDSVSVWADGWKVSIGTLS